MTAKIPPIGLPLLMPDGRVTREWYQYLNEVGEALFPSGGDALSNVYTKGEADALLGGKANSSHTHDASDVDSGAFEDERIAQSNVTQHEDAIDHDALYNYEEGQHRTINDSGTGGTDLYSAEKIISTTSSAQGYGFVQYTAANYTSGSPLVLLADTQTSMAVSSLTALNNLQGEAEGHVYIDGSGLFDPRAEKDVYEVRVTLTASPDVADTDILLELDIGGTPGVIDSDRRIAVTAGSGNEITFSLSFYALSTFQANGGTMRLTASSDTDIYDVVILVIPHSTDRT